MTNLVQTILTSLPAETGDVLGAALGDSPDASFKGLAAVVPMLLAAFAYWGVGMPLGAGLGFGLGWGAPGIWAGLVAGLSFAAVLLGWRLRRSLRRLEAAGA